MGRSNPGSSASQGMTYYVAPQGSNQNPGTIEQPWATPGYGARRLKPGDTLVIRAGQYVLSSFDEDMITPPSGLEDAWITIKGEEGTRPVLVGNNNLYAAFEISNAQYLRIENLEITSDRQHPFRDGISAWVPAAHVVLDNLYIHHIDGMGVNLRDIDDMQLLNSRIEYCGFGAVGGPAGEQGGWRNILIKNCRLSYSGHYYQGTPGPSPYDRPDGFGIEPAGGPIEIADTIVEHNRGDGLDSKAANTYIHHCIVANNTCDGIKLWADNSKIENCLVYGTGDGDTSESPWAGIVIDNVEQSGARFEIVNTTLANDRRERGYVMYVQYGGGVPITLVMKNCIVSHGPGKVYIGPDVSFTADHNLFYRPGYDVPIEVAGRDYTNAEVEAGALGPGNLARDPLFVNWSSPSPGGYELQVDSPAVDAGTDEGAPLDDLLHRPRPAGYAPDMGAYEYTGSITTFNASGNVATGDGTPVAGVKMTFSRVSGTGSIPDAVTTDAYGNWSQTGFAVGTAYRVTPGKPDYTFEPAYRDFSSTSTILNFTGTGQATLVVTSPNGGEIWPAGTTQTISWRYTGDPGAHVKIELLRDAEVSIIVSSTPIGSGGEGSYAWPIPANQASGTNYKVRVTSTSDSSITDTGNSEFSIIGPIITVTVPNGGETWPSGTKQTIRWSYTGNPGSRVKIELLRGASVSTIVSSTPIGSGGKGSYVWQIPANQVAGTNYRVRITSTSISFCTDTSDNQFNITGPTITVTVPNGGETWPSGTKQTIRWSYTGNPGARVKIELLRGASVSTIVSSTPIGSGGKGSYAWKIPATQTAGTNYKVRSTSTSKSFCTDTSNKNFNISGPTITVTVPNGGETWSSGTKQTIRWSYTGNPGTHVKIELLRGTSSSTIVSSTPIGSGGKGSYAWKIPATQAAGTNYRVRITSTSKSYCTDTSNNNFNIKS